MRFLIVVAFTVGLYSLLAACALPDLVAHAVKEVEKSQRDGGVRSSQSSNQPMSTDRVEEEPPPPISAPQPHRSSVTVEELPAR